MKKLLAGIRDFHERVRPDYRERFAHLALGQSPDCLFVACSDSRVVPNLFASTDPGDLFVLRNVGNTVPPCIVHGRARGDGLDASAGAAVEFATVGLGVRDIVVCGHSSCGAMQAVMAEAAGDGGQKASPNLDRWLSHTRASLQRLAREPTLSPALPAVDRLSQVHVLEQLEHLRTYPAVAERLADGRIRLSAWWFDLANAEVLAYSAETHAFLPLVELMGELE